MEVVVVKEEKIMEVYEDKGITFPKGFLAYGLAAGLKKSGKKDLALIYTPFAAKGAAVFTTNLVKAAPLLVTEEHLLKSDLKAVVANSGQANACTGQEGLDAAYRMAEIAAAKLKIKKEEVAVASTGVIGEIPNLELVEKGLEECVANLNEAGGKDAAEAIMTTDTRSKEVAVSFKIGEKEVRIGAMAKGSGMIHPNMATLLAFVTTDAAISAELLKKALKKAVDTTLNMVSIDGDTSTNDMALILANSQSQNLLISEENADYELFVEALTLTLTKMAILIAADGEGATKLITIKVKGAPSTADARLIARTISTSNLVKTAVFGCDANWGRILCAAGYSGAKFDPDLTDIFLKSKAGEVTVALEGRGVPFDEELAFAILSAAEVEIFLNLNQGKGEATAWTCDFSYDYVRINAEYRT